jgi:excisionase family DNA binding protein
MDAMTHEAKIPLLTIEVARILQLAPETVRLMERRGRLHAVKTARGVRLFDREEVERFARERERRRTAVPTSTATGPRA